MAKRLLYIATAVLGIVWSGVSEAKVCRLGDPGCETNGFFGAGDGQCSDQYKPCANPRAGATYCFGTTDGIGSPQALYRVEDCCSALQEAPYNYQECSIENGQTGYGLSCHGAADNITYWQQCGCTYGFVDETDVDDIKIQDVATGADISFGLRCFVSDYHIGDCRLADCNKERHFVSGANESELLRCKYRLDTRCGAFGCMQVYDCNHDEIDTGKEYYRNDAVELRPGKPNFIDYLSEDGYSNERRSDGSIKLISIRNEDGTHEFVKDASDVIGVDYNLINRYVCQYKDSTGSITGASVDEEEYDNGFNCNAVENYCYLWDGCNKSRRWYNSNTNMGAVYNLSGHYARWMQVVEKDMNYHPEYPHLLEIPQHLNFYRQSDINPNYGVYTKINPTDIDAINGSNCGLVDTDGDGVPDEGNCIVDPNKGCTYIVGDCHQDGDVYPSHRCWKKISCTEENRFYASFVNIAPIDANGNSTDDLYESSLSVPGFRDAFYTGLEADEIYPACIYEINNCNDDSGCYRKSEENGCITGFEDIRKHPELEIDWEPWFNAWRPICNDSTRCYKASSCDLTMGSYSSAPNTSFFVTISSTATSLTCYKGESCREEAGSYTSEPNTSFFVTISSHATSSICYRGESCYIEGGAYSSAPNVYFFEIQHSISSGSTCYRGVLCMGLDKGAYTSSPNTSFFNIITSAASSSHCYRGTSCYTEAGSYTSEPNTSFFVTISSHATGSLCYRGQNCYIEGGAYSSEPNTSFFVTINSLSSGSICYRGENCYIEGGAYSSEPNTSFFTAINSLSSGSTCYRGQNCYIEGGAYSSEPNTSFFVIINSLSSGSTCYRGESCWEDAGSYTSEPNTSFFVTINSLSSGSTCYRGQNCYIEGGAYSSSPNTAFFLIHTSIASGSTCYRGIECTEEMQGSYSTSPNTVFFEVISSSASGSNCYRGQNCNYSGGSYSSSPNTSFFNIIFSIATGSTCYRGFDCHLETGSYTSEPNTSFFVIINSLATGSTCYRGQSCYIEGGSYSSTPSTVFFSVINSVSSSSICYRGEDCAETSASVYVKNTSFFNYVTSSASGSVCYRSTECNWNVGAYSSTPNTSFFSIISSTNAVLDSTCYRGEMCHLEAGSYSSTPNTSFFVIISSYASGSTSYRGQNSHIEAGSYSSTPNTSFFITISSLASGSTSYRGQNSHIEAGSYSSTPNTSFFITISSLASGSTAYRGQNVHIASGAYSSIPNLLFFHVITSHASGSISYRADGLSESSYAFGPNTSFFVGISSQASGSVSYRVEKVHIPAGSYSSTPNTSFFYIITSEGSGSTSYRGQNAHLQVGAYSSMPNTSFFFVIRSLASGSTAYRGESVRLKAGSYSSTPNTSFFFVINSLSSGSTSYRGQNSHRQAGSYSSTPNTSFFSVIKSLSSGSTAYRGQNSHRQAGSYSSTPNTSFFITISSLASGSTAYRGQNVHTEAGAYSSTPLLAFFEVDTSYASGSTCYRGASCTDSSVAEEVKNTSFFVYVYSLASGSTCYRSSACRLEVGAYSSTPNTSFFNVLTSTNAASDSTCYRSDGCNLEAGAYSSTPNTSFFITISSEAAGSTAYRGQNSHRQAGSYSSTPNTSFFFVIKSLASGSTSYRGQNSHREVGAYSSTPNTSFFFVIKSLASGSTAYRGQNSHRQAGSYSSTPNTSFFNVIKSLASGSTSYRADDIAKLTIGAYSSTPNTSFFFVIKSLASGSTAYRGQNSHRQAGSYSSAPNTSFFNVIKSLASGSTSYRADDIAKLTIGAYSSTPNTSFFFVIKSLASGSTSYRGQNSHRQAGSYSSTPNTSFFITISSLASGSTAYRGESIRSDNGVYSSTPNTSFFFVIKSLASGSTAYRGQNSHIEVGAYSSVPNTSFFITISSLASGSTSYRGQNSHREVGAYSSTPNTSFFFVIKSLASGSTSYRGQNSHREVGAYSSAPNTSFFITISSLASGSTSYRGQNSHRQAGSYSSTPNTSFFSVIKSLASGSTSYRADDIAKLTIGAYSSTPNTSFFFVIKSLASGSTAYRGQNSHIEVGAYSSAPNTLFFHTISSKASGSISYRADRICTAEECGYYINNAYVPVVFSSSPSTSFFFVIKSLASGSTAYRVERVIEGSYSSTPNTSFFIVITSYASGSTSYRGEKSHIAAGAYSSTPNTLFFNVIKSLASGSTSYRGESAATTRGAYSSMPNTSFFITISSLASGSTSYRGKGICFDCGAYTTTPNIAYFNVITSSASGKTSYRGESAATTRGAYSSVPNTSFFTTGKSLASGSTAYRGMGAHLAAGSYSSTPNTNFFITISSQASSIICFRGESCGTAVGSYSSTPNSQYFTISVSKASGSTCYRGDACNSTNKSKTYAEVSSQQFVARDRLGLSSGSMTYGYEDFFNYVTSGASGNTCYRAIDCNFPKAYSIKPDTSFFVIVSATDTPIDTTTNTSKPELTCYIEDRCHIVYGAYSVAPNAKFFYYERKDSNDGELNCYRGRECMLPEGSYTSAPNTMFFNTISSKASGSTCYRGASCATTRGAYSTAPSIMYFVTISSKATGQECFRGIECTDETITVLNTSYFITTKSQASGIICHRGDVCHIAAGAYSSTPNTVFFKTTYSTTPTTGCYRGYACQDKTTNYQNTSYFGTFEVSKASGITCYRGNACNIAVGAYSVKPNTSFFVTSSVEQKTLCYRADRCHTEAGAYTSNTYTTYHNYAVSKGSGYTCYRSTGCNISGGAYSSVPNTMFFNTLKVEQSGSKCYRGNGCASSNGAVSYPSITYFNYISSKASGDECYRATSCAIIEGAYSVTPNTSFFNTVGITHTSTTCYRGNGCRTNAGSYTSTTRPNELFFVRISSQASGTTCYRAERCASSVDAKAAGERNTSYFVYNESSASGIKCYRADACAIGSGAMTSSSRNTLYFSYNESTEAGQTCYRVKACHIEAGAYSVTPNTSFFNTVSESQPNSTCYRVNATTPCRASSGSYTSSPSTIFFEVEKSLGSGKTCYRATGCKEPYNYYVGDCNTSYFYNTDTDGGVAKETWSNITCVTTKTMAIGVRESDCITSDDDREDYFNYYTWNDDQKCAGITAYYVTGCNADNLSYNVDSVKNYTVTDIDNNIDYKLSDVFKFYGSGDVVGNACTELQDGSPLYCAVACACNNEKGWYSTKQDGVSDDTYSIVKTDMFGHFMGDSGDNGAGLTSAIGPQIADGRSTAMTLASVPMTPITTKTTASMNRGFSATTTSATCYKLLCPSGYYTSKPSTSYFEIDTKTISDLNCYKVIGCKDGFINVKDSYFSDWLPNKAYGGIDASGEFECYEQPIIEVTLDTKDENDTCTLINGWLQPTWCSTGDEATTFVTPYIKDITIKNLYGQNRSVSDVVSVSTVRVPFMIGGHGTYTPYEESSTQYDTLGLYFSVSNGSLVSDAYNKTQVRQSDYEDISTTMPNWAGISEITGLYNSCPYAEWATGEYALLNNTITVSTPDNYAFKPLLKIVRNDGCTSGYGPSKPNTSFFVTNTSYNGSNYCYRSTGCHTRAGADSVRPNTQFFYNISSYSSGLRCYRANGCNTSNGAFAYDSTNNTYFNHISSIASSVKCYRATSCNEEKGSYAYSSKPSSYFKATYRTQTGVSCVWGIDCAQDGYAVSPTPEYFNGVACGPAPQYMTVNVNKTTSSQKIDCADTDTHSGGCYTDSYNIQTATIKVTDSNYISYSGLRFSDNHSASLQIQVIYDNYDIGGCTTQTKILGAYKNAYGSWQGANTIQATQGVNFCNDITFSVIGVSDDGNYSNYLDGSANSRAYVSYESTTKNISIPPHHIKLSITDNCTGGYADSPDTSYFAVETENNYCYRATACNTKAGAYETAPDVAFFNVIERYAYTYCYRATGCASGAYASKPSEKYFNIDSSKASGSTCYRATGCKAPYTTDSSGKFVSEASGIRCYVEKDCPDSIYFGLQQNESTIDVGYSLSKNGVVDNNYYVYPYSGNIDITHTDPSTNTDFSVHSGMSMFMGSEQGVFPMESYATTLGYPISKIKVDTKLESGGTDSVTIEVDNNTGNGTGQYTEVLTADVYSKAMLQYYECELKVGYGVDTACPSGCTLNPPPSAAGTNYFTYTIQAETGGDFGSNYTCYCNRACFPPAYESTTGESCYTWQGGNTADNLTCCRSVECPSDIYFKISYDVDDSGENVSNINIDRAIIRDGTSKHTGYVSDPTDVDLDLTIKWAGTTTSLNGNCTFVSSGENVCSLSSTSASNSDGLDNPPFEVKLDSQSYLNATIAQASGYTSTCNNIPIVVEAVKNDSGECPDGYFATEPDASFVYQTSGNCYKPIGCKAGYTSEYNGNDVHIYYDSKSNGEILAMECYPDNIYIGIYTYCDDTSNSSDKLQYYDKDGNVTGLSDFIGEDANGNTGCDYHMDETCNLAGWVATGEKSGLYNGSGTELDLYVVNPQQMVYIDGGYTPYYNFTANSQYRMSCQSNGTSYDCLGNGGISALDTIGVCNTYNSTQSIVYRTTANSLVYNNSGGDGIGLNNLYLCYDLDGDGSFSDTTDGGADCGNVVNRAKIKLGTYNNSTGDKNTSSSNIKIGGFTTLFDSPSSNGSLHHFNKPKGSCPSGWSPNPPSTSYFASVATSNYSGVTCYRGLGCNASNGYFQSSQAMSASSSYTFDQYNYDGTVKTGVTVPSTNACYKATSCKNAGLKLYRNPGLSSTQENLASSIGSIDTDLFEYIIDTKYNSNNPVYRYSYCAGVQCANTALDETPSYEFSYTTSTLVGTTCYKIDGCNNPEGYYQMDGEADTDYFIVSSSTVNGITCASLECRFDEVDPIVFATTESSVELTLNDDTTKTETCYIAIGCNSDNYFTIVDNGPVFGESNGISCYTADCATYAGNNYGYVMPYEEEYDGVEVHFNGYCGAGSTGAHSTYPRCEKCKPATCPTGYYYSAVNPTNSLGIAYNYYPDTEKYPNCYQAGCQGQYSTTGINTADSYTSVLDGDNTTCYAICPTGYKYFSTTYGLSDDFTYREHDDYPNCYKIGCNYLNGLFGTFDSPAPSSAAEYFDLEVSYYELFTNSKEPCYKAIGCTNPEYPTFWKKGTTIDTTAYIIQKSPKENSNILFYQYYSCYRAECNFINGYYSSSSSISSTYFTTSSVSNGSIECYYATGCNESNGYTSRANGTAVAESGSVKCYNKPCPEGYYYRASAPTNSTGITYTTHSDTTNYPNCYQASCTEQYSTTGANTSDSYASVLSGDDTICSARCPEYYTYSSFGRIYSATHVYTAHSDILNYPKCYAPSGCSSVVNSLTGAYYDQLYGPCNKLTHDCDSCATLPDGEGNDIQCCKTLEGDILTTCPDGYDYWDSKPANENGHSYLTLPHIVIGGGATSYTEEQIQHCYEHHCAVGYTSTANGTNPYTDLKGNKCYVQRTDCPTYFSATLTYENTAPSSTYYLSLSRSTGLFLDASGSIWHMPTEFDTEISGSVSVSGYYTVAGSKNLTASASSCKAAVCGILTGYGKFGSIRYNNLGQVEYIKGDKITDNSITEPCCIPSGIPSASNLTTDGSLEFEYNGITCKVSAFKEVSL